MRPSPEPVVQAQLDAYNAHDLDAFVACYAEDVAVRGFPGGVLRYRGRDALRGSYRELFEAHPALRAELTNRILLGPYCIDHERVHGARADGRAVPVVAIYLVRGEVITDVWFVGPPPPREG